MSYAVLLLHQLSLVGVVLTNAAHASTLGFDNDTSTGVNLATASGSE